ncbi:hypothetical protein PVAP13_9KG259113 [Panicum virgatum]|uniref:Uncharacterized protein n=1 Tax=Panicum virgatum TaxID=38727 RepID=A0A8T0NMK1_PANVG|nr:hypothetical protein PVAP13_9KG259113 [Panicum virgatum]
MSLPAAAMYPESAAGLHNLDIAPSSLSLGPSLPCRQGARGGAAPLLSLAFTLARRRSVLIAGRCMFVPAPRRTPTICLLKCSSCADAAASRPLGPWHTAQRHRKLREHTRIGVD